MYSTGQGNSASGNMRRDTLCLAFKFIKNMKLGVRIESPITKQTLHRLAIAFVDNTDFYSS